MVRTRNGLIARTYASSTADENIGDPGRTRTPNILIRSQVLYPVELRDRCEMLLPILIQMIKAKYHQMRQDADLARMP